MSIKFIRLAHEAGLGCGEIDQIDVVGEDISEVDWGFKTLPEHLRQPRTEANLLGPAETAREAAAPYANRALGLPGLEPVPQQVTGCHSLDDAGPLWVNCRRKHTAMKTTFTCRWGKRVHPQFQEAFPYYCRCPTATPRAV